MSHATLGSSETITGDHLSKKPFAEEDTDQPESNAHYFAQDARVGALAFAD